jgi:hypothetical protein
VEFQWENWDRTQEIGPLPEVGEVEDLIEKFPHSKKAAKEMGPFWEAKAAKLVDLDSFNDRSPGDYDLRFLGSLEKVQGLDFFADKNKDRLIVSEEAKKWLEEKIPDWISFRQVFTEDNWKEAEIAQKRAIENSLINFSKKLESNKDSKIEEGIAALEGLSQMRFPAIPYVKKALTHPNEQIREKAFQVFRNLALGTLGPPIKELREIMFDQVKLQPFQEAVPFLREILKTEKNEKIRFAVEEALKIIEG